MRETQHSARRQLEVKSITEEVAKAVKKTKTGKAVVVGEMSVEMMEVKRLARII